MHPKSWRMMSASLFSGEYLQSSSTLFLAHDRDSDNVGSYTSLEYQYQATVSNTVDIALLVEVHIPFGLPRGEFAPRRYEHDPVAAVLIMECHMCPWKGPQRGLPRSHASLVQSGSGTTSQLPSQSTTVTFCYYIAIIFNPYKCNMHASRSCCPPAHMAQAWRGKRTWVLVVGCSILMWLNTAISANFCTALFARR